jgi:hypothetical protein
MSIIRPHAIVENRNSGVDAIKLLEEPYSGIIFTYGKVSIEEDEENQTARIKFEYDVLDDANKSWAKEPFEQYLGDFLQELLRDGLERNSLTYTGGVDED